MVPSLNSKVPSNEPRRMHSIAQSAYFVLKIAAQRARGASKDGFVENSSLKRKDISFISYERDRCGFSISA